MNKLAIIGAGDLGQLIAHHAIHDNHYEVVGFFDDFAIKGSFQNDIPVLGTLSDVELFYNNAYFDCIMVGVGYKHMAARKNIFNSFLSKIPYGKIIHSSSYVDKSVVLGEGVFILPGCTLDKHVVVGNNVLLNTSVVIAHDTVVKDHCFLSPAVNIAGKTTVEECCVLGINSTIIDHLIIREGVQVAAGSVVIKSLEQKGLYAGVPAVFKKAI